MFRIILCLAVLALGACASGPPSLPYPAFVDTDALPDVFLAELPGTRAKRFMSDGTQRTGSYRVDLPVSWSGSSGASPGRSLEIFVLAGQLTLGTDLVLSAGGYAYLPPGSLGFNLKTYDGARVLYSIAAVDDAALIRTPLILDSGLVEWQPTGTEGVSEKILREDPGSGAKTWLTRIEPGAALRWEISLATRESYLVSGSAEYSECYAGKPATGEYRPGGYLRRPADIAHGGPETSVSEAAVWFNRESVAIGTSVVPDCR